MATNVHCRYIFRIKCVGLAVWTRLSSRVTRKWNLTKYGEMGNGFVWLRVESNGRIESNWPVFSVYGVYYFMPSLKSDRLDFRENVLFMVVRSLAVKQVHKKWSNALEKGTLTRPSLSFSCCSNRYGTVLTKHSVQSNYIVNTAVSTTSSAFIVICGVKRNTVLLHFSCTELHIQQN